jgi:hypothetical protein
LISWLKGKIILNSVGEVSGIFVWPGDFSATGATSKVSWFCVLISVESSRKTSLQYYHHSTDENLRSLPIGCVRNALVLMNNIQLIANERPFCAAFAVTL